MDKIYYTSFENHNDLGGWRHSSGTNWIGPDNNAKTGTGVMAFIQGSVIRGNIKSGKYILSFWTRNAIPIVSGTGINIMSRLDDTYNENQWVYHEVALTLE